MARKSVVRGGAGKSDGAPLAKLDLSLRKLVRMEDSAIRAELARLQKPVRIE